MPFFENANVTSRGNSHGIQAKPARCLAFNRGNSHGCDGLVLKDFFNTSSLEPVRSRSFDSTTKYLRLNSPIGYGKIRVSSSCPALMLVWKAICGLVPVYLEKS